VEKYCRVGQATNENMVRAHCMLDTNTHSQYVILMDFLLQKWLPDRASMLIIHIVFFRTGGENSSDDRIATMFPGMLLPQPTGVKCNEFAKNQNSVVVTSTLTTYGHADEEHRKVNTTF
jgi:hypothetical protein